MDIVSRVKNIIVSPATEWQVIAAEPTDVAGLYSGYVVLLAAIPAVCGFIGLYLLSHAGGIVAGVGGAIVRYVLDLIGVYVLGFIIAKLAPRFGAPDRLISGLKVSAYAHTPTWVFGVFQLIPSLGWIDGLAGLYGLYLLYLGLPIVMGTPASNTLTYTIATIVVAILVYIVIALVAGALFSAGMAV